MRPTAWLLPALVLLLAGCRATPLTADLSAIYNRAASNHGPQRNPVIVIPGILGSRLVDRGADGGTRLVWGAFNGKAADPSKDAGLRRIALPLTAGPLAGATDGVWADRALERVSVSVLGLPLRLDAYRQIMMTLGAAGYFDPDVDIGEAVDYGEDHYTCFQFAYDWRRDNVESAAALMDFMAEKRAEIQAARIARHGGDIDDHPVTFDIVAHSMGGLIARYALRFGGADLPADGSTPPVTWAGMDHDAAGGGGIGSVILIGTPNAGSTSAIEDLVHGTDIGPFLPRYPAAVIASFPSVYQLLPRVRHARILDHPSGEPAALYDPAWWTRHGLGLMDPDQAGVLSALGADRELAAAHLARCLARAEQFHRALDQEPPAGGPRPDLRVFIGDAVDTLDIVKVAPERRGRRRLIAQAHAPGDGTVTRAAALHDERLGPAGPATETRWTPMLQTPIPWRGVTFLHEDHLGLTQSQTFADNVLWTLLEKP